MRNVLVTGGAGYIGSVLVRLLLLNGYRVTVLDNLSFGGESIVELLNDPNFKFVKGDIRDAKLLDDLLPEINFIAHLASIVGDPACAKDPELTRSINTDGAKLLYDKANYHGVSRFVFASTCSNYGKMDNVSEYVTEESALAPVSLYAETKVDFENYLLSQHKTNSCIPTCLRFSTVYGLSPRLRFDLTVNEFTKDLSLGRELVVFGEQFWRPYCHVVDLSRAVLASISADLDKVAFEVFNVGHNEENYQKKMLIDEIKKFLPEANISYVKRDEDPRDYKVNFDKIATVLDFKITKTVPDGIKQILQVINNGIIADPDSKKYSNI